VRRPVTRGNRWKLFNLGNGQKVAHPHARSILIGVRNTILIIDAVWQFSHSLLAAVSPKSDQVF
jgi:hypothetical protein